MSRAENSGKEKEAKRLSRKWLCAIALAIIIASTTLIYLSWHSPTDQTFQLKAVIIDQATLTSVNEFFFEATMSIVKEANYTVVDYYAGEEVTVEFYRNLPSYSYSLIVMRTHSRPMAICTGEPYDKTEHVPEQLTGELVQTFVGDGTYFGITASFIKNMRGNFHNATILNMGCNALSETAIAEAFIEKGAKTYIGWKQSVMSYHTDQATILLLRHLITERKTIEQAVTETMTEMGPYPVLDYYPPEAGGIKVIADG
ncbi:MAG: hypothetical protein ACUVRA_01905 [Candidatus Bathyarchaeaceae archaeon]